MARRDFPLNPFMGHLYTPEELLGAFDIANASSFQETLDFRTYRYFVKAGRNAPPDELDSMMQALHDNSITQETKRFLEGRRVVAIMGGHKMPRDQKPYADVVNLARRLAVNRVLLASGGGPGAMEATHLGAFLANASDTDVAAAISRLATKPVVPAAANVVANDGTVNSQVAAELHAWYKPAFEVLRERGAGAESLAIPTWHYGHEPPCPFASHLAKYFQNSIREDGLLALAKHGIVFTEGKAGTIQEIFQDAAQNYYKTFDWFSPMVFLGVKYWTEDYPVVPVLQHLFGAELYATHVRVTDTIDEAVEFLQAFSPPGVPPPPGGVASGAEVETKGSTSA